MARGWESKSVESQKEDAEINDRSNRRHSQEAIDAEAQRLSLERSRTRITRELKETSSELRRKSLELALAHLDKELEKLGRP